VSMLASKSHDPKHIGSPELGRLKNYISDIDKHRKARGWYCDRGPHTCKYWCQHCEDGRAQASVLDVRYNFFPHRYAVDSLM
jgi:hypothetical protein